MFNIYTTTWQLPKEKSADKNLSMSERVKHYQQDLKHYLPDGTQVIPHKKALKHVFDAYDKFGLEVSISANSYKLT